MNVPKLSPEDPRLTAYALGELTGDERAEVEAVLRHHPSLRATVDEIRAVAAQLETALAAEPIDAELLAPGSNGHGTPLERAQLQAQAGDAGSGDADAEAKEYTTAEGRGKVTKFRPLYYIVPLLAAACFAVMVSYYQPTFDAKQRDAMARRAAELKELQEARAREATTRTALDLTPAADPAVAVAPPDPVAMPAPAPLVEPDLSLLAQTKRDLELRSSEPAIAADPLIPPVAEPEPARERSLLAGATNPLTPPQASPVAGRTSPERAPAAGTGGSFLATGSGAVGQAASPATPAVTPSAAPTSSVARSGEPSPAVLPSLGGDPVMLDAFTVAETRDTTSLAIALNEGVARPMRETDLRPHRPRGARFGRGSQAYAYARDNDFLSARQQRKSSFAADVDTASYANIRRFIEQGTRPPRDAVRIEEMLNYFPYRYVAPKEETFAVSMEVAESPWTPGNRLVRIALKGREAPVPERAPANLVFLLDVSGSMNEPNKLPLVKESLRLMIAKLRPDDRVALVTYSGHSGLALPSTPVARAGMILEALETLMPNGSTNGSTGIRLAYDIAKANFTAQGINRVILCTDGDFNVGPSQGELLELIDERARQGVSLTVLGFGMGSTKDTTIERLATRGNGMYGYIDTRREAEKLLMEQVNSSLLTIAKDLNIEVEFNETKVASYRLIGYENRLLRREDFRQEEADASDIRAGHTITALYEIVPAGPAARPHAVAADDELRYASSDAFSSRLAMPNAPRGLTPELLTVRVRYKRPNSLISLPKTIEAQLTDAGTAFASASADFRFAAAVASYGMLLRESPHRGNATLGDVLAWAANAASKPGDDPGGHRGQFIDLVRKTQAILQ